MRISATLRMALRALRRNKMRSTLTALGIIIGVGAVIAMVGIGNGAKSQVEAQIASLGQNVVLIFAGNWSSSGARSGWGGAGTLMVEDALAIMREVPAVTCVSPEVRDRDQVLANGQNWNTQVLGEGPDYLQIRDWPLDRRSDVHRPGRARHGQGMHHWKNGREPIVPGRRSGRPNPAHPRHPVQSARGAASQGFVRYEYGPGRRGAGSLHEPDETDFQADQHQFHHRSVLIVRGVFRRSSRRSPTCCVSVIGSARNATMISPSAASRRSPTPSRRPAAL